MNDYFDKLAFNFISGANSVSNDYSASEPLTLEKIKEVMKLIPPEPIREYMIKKGYNPDDGWSVIFPESYRTRLGFSWFISIPEYVNFSNIQGDYICFVQDRFTMEKLKL